MSLVQLLRFTAAVLAMPSPLHLHAGLLTRLGAFVQPRLGVVLFLLRIPAAEQPTQDLGIAKVLAQNRGIVGVRNDVIAKVTVVTDRVVDQRPEKDDVA